MQQTLSLCLIVKNEEQLLPRVLQNARLYADEIIIVDTGSQDKTKEIAASFTTSVFDFAWCDDFAAARNFAIEQCIMDFIIWLDADDVILDDDAKRIKQLIATPIDWDACFIPYHILVNARGEPTKTYLRERIFRNNKKLFFQFPVHECLKFNPGDKTVQKTNINVYHKPPAGKNNSNRYLALLSNVIEKPEYRDSARLWYHVAIEYRSTGQSVKAIQAYRTVLALLGTSSDFGVQQKSMIHYEFATELCKVGKIEEAAVHFGTAIILFPTWREPLFEYGKLLFNQKKYQDALQLFKFCQTVPLNLELHIENRLIYDGYEIYDWLSLAYGGCGDYHSAVHNINMALNLLPEDKRLLKNKLFWEDKIRQIDEKNNPVKKLMKHKRSFLVKNNPNDKWNQWIWSAVADGTWEPYTYVIFDKFIHANDTYIDIGAWIGPTVLYAATITKKVYALEPDPVAFEELVTNVNLNPLLKDRITLTKAALSTKNGTILLGSRNEGGDSMSSLLFANEKTSWVVNAMTFASYIKNNNIVDCRFIKMDIEGGECFVLPKMQTYLKKHSPTLYLSLHTPWFPNKNTDLKNIINTIMHYKNIYDVYGNKLNLQCFLESELNNETGSFTSIVATDLEWDSESDLESSKETLQTVAPDFTSMGTKC